MIKNFVLAIVFSLLVCPSFVFAETANEPAPTKEKDFSTTARVYFTNIENPVCITKEDCDKDKGHLINRIPNVEFADYDEKEDSVFLLITDKRLTTKRLITNIINGSKITKVKKIIMPIPYQKVAPPKDPFEGLSNADIKKQYDKYYKENPDLTPKNWKFD